MSRTYLVETSAKWIPSHPTPMKIRKRDDGYYWVCIKLSNHVPIWTAAEYRTTNGAALGAAWFEYFNWYLIENLRAFDDDDFLKIGEQIKRNSV